MDESDIVVIGSGAAGLSAAVLALAEGASVALFEKEPRLGGTTAVSGGVTWIPAHQRAEGHGQEDAMAYLASFPDLRVRQDMSEAYVRTGERLLDALEGATSIRFWVSEGYPDYKPEFPGGRPTGGRSFNPSPFDFAELGEWAERVYRFPADWSDVGFDAETLARLRKTSPARLGTGDDVRSVGQALVGGLLKPLVDAGVPIRTGARATEILLEDGRVTGVRIEQEGSVAEVRALRGVVLATGGFEWDSELVSAYLRGPIDTPVSPPGHTGDGLRLAMAVGAQLGNMSEAWWATGAKLPGDTIDGHERSRSIRSERTRPGSIMVNARGARFANEAQDYNSLGAAFHQLDPRTLRYENQPAWMVFDHRHLSRYGFLNVRAGEQAPDWFNGSADLEQLAERCGMDPAVLVAAVGRWNRNLAECGGDPDFDRGASAYDWFWGDADLPNGPERTLGPLDAPPYYAVPIYCGTIGTKGGPVTTVDAEVLDLSGAVIPGFYAVGNVAASMMGAAYPGAGATIGPAMLFAYRAIRHALGRPLK